MLRSFTLAFHPVLLQGLCQERGKGAGIKVNNFNRLSPKNLQPDAERH